MTDFSAASLPSGREASTRALTMPGIVARPSPPRALACNIWRRETKVFVTASAPVSSTAREGTNERRLPHAVIRLRRTPTHKGRNDKLLGTSRGRERSLFAHHLLVPFRL